MPTPGLDPVKFKEGQRAMWGSASRQWSSLPEEFAKGAALINERLLEAGGVRPGHRVLDVATGAGDPALAAAEVVGPSGSVVGIDIAPEMIAAAEERGAGYPQAEFVEGDLDSLTFPPGSFDVVLSRLGLMFSLDRDGLFRSLHQVLAPGGVLAAAVWGPEASAPMAALSGAALTARLDMPAPPAGVPGPFVMSDQGALVDELTAVGFADVSVTEFVVPFQLSSP